MKNEEAKIQCEIVKWLQSNRFYFFAVNNEAHGRSAVQQMQMVSMGLRSGVSDLVVVLPEGHVMFLEVKDAKGKQSENQIKFQERVESLGHQYHVVRSVDDVALILNFGIDKKAS